MEVVNFGGGCYVPLGDSFDATRRVLAFFELLPTCIVIFNTALGAFVNDVFFTLSNFVLQFLFSYYLYGVSLAVRSERPPAYDWQFCNAPRYAFPDPIYTTALEYCIVTALGVFSVPKLAARVGFFYRVLFLGFPVLYAVGLYANSYFYLWQLAANTALAVGASLLYVFLYSRLMSRFNVAPGARRWFTRTFGFENTIFSLQRPRRTDIVQT